MASALGRSCNDLQHLGKKEHSIKSPNHSVDLLLSAVQKNFFSYGGTTIGEGVAYDADLKVMIGGLLPEICHDPANSQIILKGSEIDQVD